MTDTRYLSHKLNVQTDMIETSESFSLTQLKNISFSNSASPNFLNKLMNVIVNASAYWSRDFFRFLLFHCSISLEFCWSEASEQKCCYSDIFFFIAFRRIMSIS